MLFNWKPILSKVFMTNTLVSEYVGKTANGNPVIGSLTIPSGIFPAIEFREVSGFDNSFNDDELYSRKYSYQISIFSQDNSHYKVQNTIDSLMRSLGFTCYHNDEVYEPDVKVFHRVLLYSRTLSNEQASILEAKYL